MNILKSPVPTMKCARPVSVPFQRIHYFASAAVVCKQPLEEKAPVNQLVAMTNDKVVRLHVTFTSVHQHVTVSVMLKCSLRL